MTSVHPHERCTCRPPRPTGRWYLSYEADRCGRLIVRSRAELRAIEAEVVRIAEQESAFRVGGIMDKSSVCGHCGKVFPSAVPTAYCQPRCEQRASRRNGSAA